MMTKASFSRVVLVALAVLGLSHTPTPAAARRALASSGEPGFGSSAPCFSWDSSSSNNRGIAFSRSAAATCGSGPIPLAFNIPVHLDTGGTKTVTLVIKTPTAGVVSCGLVEYDLAGNLAEFVEYAPFPAGSSYVARQATISVSSSNNLGVLCGYGQSNPAVEGVRLLSISY